MYTLQAQRVHSSRHASTSGHAQLQPRLVDQHTPLTRPFHNTMTRKNQRNTTTTTTVIRSSASSYSNGAESSSGEGMTTSNGGGFFDVNPTVDTPSTTTTTTARTAKPEAASTSSEPDQDVLIEFKNVHKSFGSKHILRGATFKIRRGEAVGIIGSSGTGKSTTLRIAAGLLQPDKGEVFIMGEPRQGLLADDDTSNKLKMGLVFQSGALFDSLTVKQNVGFMLYEHTTLDPELIEERVAHSLAMVGLSGVEELYPSELSGGMKKRVALARAIVSDGTDDQVEQLIMYDEPTAGLDPVASTVVEDLIRGLHVKPPPRSSSSSSNNGSAAGNNKKKNKRRMNGISSYVVVTHQHSTIRRAVDRIIFLHEGAVVWEGTVQEFDTTDEPIVRQFASGSLNGPIVYV